jgi:rhodanese-related sulfurtransferase
MSENNWRGRFGLGSLFLEQTMAEMKSRVLEIAPAAPADAVRHFSLKLSLETDPSDLHADLQAKVPGLVVVDGRSPEAFSRQHIPGAVNLWHRAISAETTASFSKDTVYVCYCTGVGCNASTKAALKFASLGFKVKELVGGLQWWKDEGYSVEGTEK